MKRFKPRFSVLISLVAATLLIPEQSHARLPRPIRANGTVMAVDVDSKMLLFKPAKGNKPFLLDWNKETEFSNGGKTIAPGQIACPASATIDYRDLTFRHPLLKKVTVGADQTHG